MSQQQQQGPPPPPHGSNSKSSGLPPGNYDIFIIPPHSSGSGFLYLPSLRPNVNSFIAGVACTLLAVWMWITIQPMLKAWVHAMSSSGSFSGVIVLVMAVGMSGWIFGRTGGNFDGFEGFGSPKSGQNGAAGGTTGAKAGSNGYTKAGGPSYGHGTNGGFGQQHHGPGGTTFGRDHAGAGTSPNGGPNFTFGGSNTYTYSNSSSRPSPSSAWERAREETRKREEERKRNEAAAKRAEEERQAKERAEKEARAAAQKARWEQDRAREKEAREREDRERRATTGGFGAKSKDDDHIERLKRAADRAEQIRRERAQEERDRERGAKSERVTPTFGVGERTDPYAKDGAQSTVGAGYAAENPGGSPKKDAYQKPSAQSYTGTSTDHAFRPYDTPPPPPPPQHTSKRGDGTSSHPTASEKSYDGTKSTTSESTAPSSVFSSTPYSTTDPRKIVILGAYKVNDHHPKPVATVRPGEAGITDGLIMRFGTEGVFLDDDRKREALRQWDVKAWSMKAVETVARPGLMIVRVGIKDPENSRILYFIGDAEEWKVKEGLKTLKGGSLSKGTSFGTLSKADTDKILKLVGSLTV